MSDAAAFVDAGSERRPEFLALNCSHPLELATVLSPEGWTERLRAIRPNASKKDKIELCQIGYLEEGDPVELGALTGELARTFGHIDIWGGCRGTTSTHLDRIANGVAAARSLPTSSSG